MPEIKLLENALGDIAALISASTSFSGRCHIISDRPDILSQWETWKKKT